MTQEESQKFWGIYNDHMNKEHELKRTMRDLREDIPSMSESEADQAIKSWLEKWSKRNRFKEKHLLSVAQSATCQQIGEIAFG